MKKLFSFPGQSIAHNLFQGLNTKFPFFLVSHHYHHQRIKKHHPICKQQVCPV